MNNSCKNLHQQNLELSRQKRQFLRRDRGARQVGAIAVMFAVLLIPVIALCGLAIDLGMVYARKADMQSAARAIALSAAGKLNGSAAGIDAAVIAAASVAAGMRFQNNTNNFAWSPTALKFAASPNSNADWMDSGSASASAATVFYVKVDTMEMADAGTVGTAFMRILAPAFATVTVGSEVKAGRTSIDIMPLAVCAMSTAPATSRANPNSYLELVEYGFRRGISYDLMRLSPSSTTPLSYAINPIAAPGKTASGAGFSTDTLGPYTCRGRLGIPSVKGGTISVSQPFPLASLYRQLNSRFDQYEGNVCTPNGAPPDTNIKSYDFATLAWTNAQPSGQTAAESISGTKLQTVAEVFPAVAAPAQFGPLWAYAKAVPYSSYQAKPIEPSAGYTAFSTSAWQYLYNNQSAKTYPASLVPYRVSAVGANFAKPSAEHAPGVRNRRILNVPLLDCSSTPSDAATVLGIGRFFMTVPATDKVLAAEFGGAFQPDQITGNVGIFE